MRVHVWDMEGPEGDFEDLGGEEAEGGAKPVMQRCCG
jgi:hypothetical protein